VVQGRPENREDVAPGFNPFWVHVGGTSVLGLVLLGFAIRSLGSVDAGRLGAAFWLVSGLIIAAELRPLVMPGASDADGVQTSSAFVFAVLLHWGFAVALLLQAIATVLADGLKRKAWWRTTFNVAQFTLSWGAAAAVLRVFDRLGTPNFPHSVGGRDLSVILLAGAAQLIVNDVLVSRALGLLRGMSFRSVILDDWVYQLVTTGALFALAPLLVVALERSAWFVPLFMLPLGAVYQNAAISRQQEFASLHDTLTGLPNRELLFTHASDALADSRRTGTSVGLFLLDLDRFKEINDTLGHQLGDRLLQLVAGRLSATLRPGDTVARLGGDEFAVLLTEIPDAVTAMDVAQRTRSALTEAFELDTLTLELEASIGVACAPHHGDDVELLLQRADVAMYVAKDRRTGVEMYDPSKDGNSPARLSLLGDLRRAIEEGELVLHYQPKAQLPDGQVHGVEALLRWAHPDRGMVPPDDFIPAAEQSGIMRPLTRYVIDQALTQVAAWKATGLDVQVAVNVSMRDLHDADLPAYIRDRLFTHDVPVTSLILEVTEGVLMADPNGVADTLRGLDELGVALSLDDFGTGYSSLVHLKRLPLREIKIDRSFVQRMDEEEDDATIVRSIIDLGDALGLRVVAEGVETASAWDALSRMGCDAAQGWYLSRAMPADEATAWLEQARRRRRRRRLSVVSPTA
jgi:diguanylate cyclase (GGDEF)-like protein